MIESIVDYLEKFVTQFSWRRSIITLLTIFGICFFFWLFDQYTGYFKLRQYEKSVEILEKLASLSNDNDIKNNKELLSIYNGLIRNLDEFNNKRYFDIYFSKGLIWIFTIKILPVYAPWVIILFIHYLSPKKKKINYKIFLFGIFFIASLLALIGYFIPTFNNYLYLNYLIYPLISFLVMFSIIYVYAQSKKADNKI